MKQIEGTPNILMPSAGMRLTQSDENIALSDRIVASCVYLAPNDSADRWCEIDKESADAIIASQKKYMSSLPLIQDV